MAVQDQWDTVLFATGRQAATQALNLQAVGVETEPSSGKLVVDHREETTAGGIFAIGDAINVSTKAPLYSLPVIVVSVCC